MFPGEFFQSLVKIGLCANSLSERVCYDLMELVVGMDSKNIDQVGIHWKIAKSFFSNEDFKLKLNLTMKVRIRVALK